MREEERLSEAEREAEQALSALRPKKAAIDLHGLSIEAARRSMRRQVCLWRGIAAGLAAGLVLALVVRPGPRIVREYVRQDVPRPVQRQNQDIHPAIMSEPVEPVPARGSDYLSMRDYVLAYGMAALPAARPSAAGSEAPLPVMRDPRNRADHVPALTQWLDALSPGEGS